MLMLLCLYVSILFTVYCKAYIQFIYQNISTLNVRIPTSKISWDIVIKRTVS